MIKQIFFCATFLFIACAPPPQATDLDKKTENVVTINLSKADIYNKCLQWMATTFVSSKHVIELQDSVQGIIIGNGIVYTTWQLLRFEMHFKIRIDIKDQKYRFSSFNYIAHYETSEGSDMAKELADLTREQINTIEKSLYTYLTENSKSNDF